MISSASSRLLASVLCAAVLVSVGMLAEGAERSSPITERSTTQVVVRLATEDTLAVQARFQDSPPTLHIKFPEGRVTGSLPERSVIRRGAIDDIRIAYGEMAAPARARWIEVLSIRLRAPYPYTVRPEPGRVVITIEHPATISSDAIELGVFGDTTASGLFMPPVSERFRAMQEALTRAGPQPWALISRPELPAPATRVRRRPSASPAALNTIPWTPQPRVAPPPAASAPRPAVPASSAHLIRRAAPRAALGGWWARWWWTLLGLVGIGVLSAVWWVGRRQGWWEPRRRAVARTPHSSSATRILDHLVWRAFERQGYALLQTIESSGPIGTIRVVSKEGAKAAVLCVGDGAFFEKTLVEQFVQVLQGLQLSQGYLIVPGSFTVPAQRYAKANGVALMSREHLIELLSAGAIGEQATAQVQKVQAQLDEAKETLTQYAQQLDVIRRQRNEASWFLAEARAKAATFETELEGLRQRLRQSEEEAARWQQEAEQRRKQWEESQWYLGEARACAQHQEQQLKTLHEAATQLQSDVAHAKAALEEGERLWQGTQRALETERAIRQSLEAEREALRRHGERRKDARLSRSDIQVEVRDAQGGILFEGSPRDLSRIGIGLEIPQLNDHLSAIQIRVRLPGLEQAIEATGRIVWQQQDLSTSRSRIGCAFDALPSDAAGVFEQTLARLNN